VWCDDHAAAAGDDADVAGAVCRAPRPGIEEDQVAGAFVAACEAGAGLPSCAFANARIFRVVAPAWAVEFLEVPAVASGEQRAGAAGMLGGDVVLA